MNDDIFIVSIKRQQTSEQIAVSGYFSSKQQAHNFLINHDWEYKHPGMYELTEEFSYAVIETLPCLDYNYKCFECGKEITAVVYVQTEGLCYDCFDEIEGEYEEYNYE